VRLTTSDNRKLDYIRLRPAGSPGVAITRESLGGLSDRLLLPGSCACAVAVSSCPEELCRRPPRVRGGACLGARITPVSPAAAGNTPGIVLPAGILCLLGPGLHHYEFIIDSSAAGLIEDRTRHPERAREPAASGGSSVAAIPASGGYAESTVFFGRIGEPDGLDALRDPDGKESRMSSLGNSSKPTRNAGFHTGLQENRAVPGPDGSCSHLGCAGCFDSLNRSLTLHDAGCACREPHPAGSVRPRSRERADRADLQASAETLSRRPSKTAKHPARFWEAPGTSPEGSHQAHRGAAVANPANASLSRMLIRASPGDPADRVEPPDDWNPQAPVPERQDLEVRFFAHFAVFHGGRELPLPADKNATAILKYLMAHRRRPVSQDCLKGWLWPESSPAKARLSLNSAVYSLRRFLCAELPPGSSSSPVLLESGHYRLSPEIRVSLDAEAFDLHYERGRRLEKELRVQEAVAEYGEALALYRGDYLSESFYEGAVDWATIERERLSEACMDMLNRLARHYLETRQFQESIVTCYRLLDKDCCHEDSYRILMRCYARLGLRVRSLHHYRLCRQTLAHQYGMDTSPETEAVYKSLLRGESI